MEHSKFLNKKCKVVLSSGFVLYGIINDIDTFGIVLETEQKMSYLTFSAIQEISPDDGDF